MKKIYSGKRSGVGGQEVKVKYEDGRQRPLRHVECHSPDGFEWGYGGSGPADLALSILSDMGLGEKEAFRLHQQFKADVIAGLKRDEFELAEAEVQAWIDAYRKSVPIGDYAYPRDIK